MSLSVTLRPDPEHTLVVRIADETRHLEVPIPEAVDLEERLRQALDTEPALRVLIKHSLDAARRLRRRSPEMDTLDRPSRLVEEARQLEQRAIARKLAAPAVRGGDLRIPLGAALAIAACSSCGGTIELRYDEDNANVAIVHAGEKCAEWEAPGQLSIARIP